MILDIDINETASVCLDKLERGEIDGLDILLFAKKLENLAKMLKDDDMVKSDAIDEMDKYSKGDVCIRKGYKFSYYSKPTYSYDFEEYKRLKGVLKEITSKKIKPLEDMAKSLLNQGVESAFFPNEDGEEIEVKAAMADYSHIIRIQEEK